MQKSRLYLSFIRVLFVLMALSVGAAAAHAQTESSAPTEQPEDTQNIEQLIETLESDTAREELISELKALVETREQDAEEPAPELAEAMKLDEAAQAWKQTYVDFLEAWGLNASLVGYLIASAAIVIAALILLYLAKRIIRLVFRRLMPLAVRYHLNRQRLGFYAYVWRLCAYAVILMAMVGALAALWGVDLEAWIPRNIQLLILQAVISTVTILALAAIVVEASDAAVEHFFHRRLSHHQARMNTLLPIARTVLLITLISLFGLTLLSQLGVNVMPLLAGAGVVGFAVGFGAQALVKDVITGFIIIVEDLIQVGDVAGLGGKTGLVERITIRKVQLRDLNGAVYTVPFSEVSIVENLTKDFSYYLMDVGVAYREDTDRVVELLKEICAGMQAEDEYKDKILEPIEILGVDKFADSAVIIKARIKTVPIQQWTVGREFNRRMKKLFDEQNIEIPFPHRTLYFGQDKDGSAPAMQLALQNQPSANDTGTTA